MYALDTKRRQKATGDMYDYKRRGSEVERAALAPRRERAARKVAAVSRLVVTHPACNTDELKLPQIVVGRGLASLNTSNELAMHPSTSTVGKCVFMWLVSDMFVSTVELADKGLIVSGSDLGK